MIEMPSLPRRYLTLALAACCAVIMPVFAEISISGEQDGVLETNEYIVTGLITVKRGKTLKFAPGSIVRFKRYAGIVVEGALKCAGSPGLPLVFTSNNHRSTGSLSKDAPAPFDWNGILVADSSARLDFEYVRVAYSTFGLDIKSPAAAIRLKNAVFDGNGQGNVRVNGVTLEVKDNEPFSYVQPQGAEIAATAPSPPAVWEPESPVTARPDTVPVKKPAKKGAWKAPVRIGFCVVALAGGAACSWYLAKAFKYQDDYDRRDIPTSEVDEFARKRDDAIKGTNMCAIIGGAGIAGLTITFFF